MKKSLVIKIAKYIGVTLAILSIIYTLLQIFDYYRKSKDQIAASSTNFDLNNFINPLERSTQFGNTFAVREVNATQKEVLSKYLKIPFPKDYFTSFNDTIINKQIDELRRVLTSPLLEILVNGREMQRIAIKNVSDKEIKDVKIDFTEWSSFTYKYHYITKGVMEPIMYTDLKLVEMNNTQKVIQVGNLLPNETKEVLVFGLTYRITGAAKYPRIIYPDGYVYAHGGQWIYNSGKFDEWLTDFVVSSSIVQFAIAILTILGILYFFKLCMKLAKVFFQNK